MEQTGFTVGALWNQRALTETPLTRDKLEVLARSVMAKCDAVDGLADGLIDDPRQCAFDPMRDVPSPKSSWRIVAANDSNQGGRLTSFTAATCGGLNEM